MIDREQNLMDEMIHMIRLTNNSFVLKLSDHSFLRVITLEGRKMTVFAVFSQNFENYIQQKRFSVGKMIFMISPTKVSLGIKFVRQNLVRFIVLEMQKNVFSQYLQNYDR